MRDVPVYLLLLLIKAASRLFFSFEIDWVGNVPRDRWKHVRVIAILNHTSLFEPILAGAASPGLLWGIAHRGVVPVAAKTLRRQVGTFFRLLARHVVEVTRRPDETWRAVLDKIDDRAMVVILPEGRMKRRNGLDSEGRTMTVRGGISDILRGLPDGRLLLVYSGGLHHIQAPGERIPRPFRRVRVRLEVVDIAAYRQRLLAESGEEGFKRAVVADLECRRDAYCPSRPETDAPEAPPELRRPSGLAAPPPRSAPGAEVEHGSQPRA